MEHAGWVRESLPPVSELQKASVVEVDVTDQAGNHPNRMPSRRIYRWLALMGLLLGLIAVPVVMREHRRWRALEHLRFLDAAVIVDSAGGGLPFGWRLNEVDLSGQWKGFLEVDGNLVVIDDYEATLRELQYFPELRVLRLESPLNRNRQPGDNGLEFVRGFKSLEELSVGGLRITPRGMDVLQSLPRLQRLELGVTYSFGTATSRNRDEIPAAQIDDDTFRLLVRCRSLEEVWLRGMNVSDSTVAYLSDLPRLRVINLTGTQVTDVTLQWLARKATVEKIVLTEMVPRLSMVDSIAANQTETRITARAVEEFRRLRPDVLVVYRNGAYPVRLRSAETGLD
jgi:hypothetical protein